jgi:hypothetical protein
MQEREEETEAEPLVIDVAGSSPSVREAAVRIWLQILREDAGLSSPWSASQSLPPTRA